MISYDIILIIPFIFFKENCLWWIDYSKCVNESLWLVQGETFNSCVLYTFLYSFEKNIQIW